METKIKKGAGCYGLRFIIKDKSKNTYGKVGKIHSYLGGIYGSDTFIYETISWPTKSGFIRTKFMELLRYKLK